MRSQKFAQPNPLPRRWGDLIFSNLTRFFALVTLLLMAGILVSLIWSAMPSLRAFGLDFLFSREWNPPEDRFGALIPIYGTLVTALIALLIALPVSFGIALFLTEMAPRWLRAPLGIAIELLAGIPSIVYGIWGLLFFAPFFAQHVQPFLAATLGKLPFIGALFSGPPLGIGLLSAGIILAIMITPFIAAVMRDVFELVPPMLKESCYGLGGTTWETVRYIILPHTRVGLIGGVMLGFGRALGETMAVTFVIGNATQLSNFSLFMPGNSITSALANEFSEASPGLYTASLIELGLILFIITLIVLSCSKLLLLSLEQQANPR